MVEQTFEHAPRADEATGELIREALDETRELVRIEVALAREEVRAELGRAKVGAIALGAGAALAVMSLSLLLVAIALSFSTPWLTSLVVGLVLLGLAAALAFGGWKAMPARPLALTKDRIASDLKQLKERVA